MNDSIASNFSFSEFEQKIGSQQLYKLLFILISLTLFFIQALRSYVPGVYVAMFHVVFGEDVIINFMILITLIFYILPALTNTICKKWGVKRTLNFSIFTTAIARTLLAFHFPNIWQVILSGITILFYCIFISIFLSQWMEEDIHVEKKNKLIIVMFSIFSAFLIDYLIRSLGVTEDISLLPPGLIADYWYLTQYLWLIIQIPLAIGIIYFTKSGILNFSLEPISQESKKKPLSSRYLFIFVGIGMFFFLMFSLFLYPNIISHYTQTNYYVNTIFNIISLMIALIIVIKIDRTVISNIKLMVILNSLMLIILFLFLFLEGIANFLISILLSGSLIIMYLNFYLLFAQITQITLKWEKVKTISNALSLSLVFYLIFIIMHILSTDWAYVLEILKGTGPFIVLIAGILFSITTIISIHIKTEKEGRINE